MKRQEKWRKRTHVSLKYRGLADLRKDFGSIIIFG